MMRYTLGDGSTGYIDYYAVRITRRALARIGKSTRSGWRAVGITTSHAILVVGPGGYWYVI